MAICTARVLATAASRSSPWTGERKPCAAHRTAHTVSKRPFLAMGASLRKGPMGERPRPEAAASSCGAREGSEVDARSDGAPPHVPLGSGKHFLGSAFPKAIPCPPRQRELPCEGHTVGRTPKRFK